HLAVVVGLIVIGWRHFQDLAAGMASATLYLILPYTAYHVAQIHHVFPTAFLVWAVAAYRRPTLAGGLLGLATAFGYYPALLLPVWLSFYWQRGTGRFLLGFLCTTGLCFALVAALSVLGFRSEFWTESELVQTLRMALWDWSQAQTVVSGFW